MTTLLSQFRTGGAASYVRRFAAGTLALFALAACDKSSTGPTPQATLLLRNEANIPIVSVNIALCTDDSWGGNKLNASETIAPGATRSWSLTPGCWDVRASTELKSGSWFDRDLVPGDTLRLALPSSAGTSLVAGRAESPLKLRR